MRFKQDRTFYRPNPEHNQNIHLIQFEDIPGSEVYTYENRNGKLAGIAFAGRRQKPDWHFSFFNEQQRQDRIESWAKCQRDQAAYKAKHKIERSKPHTLTMGDILYTSWGYDQTNVDFYQVVELIGKCTVIIREIAQKTMAGHGGPSESVVAVKDSFTGGPMTKRANSTNRVRIASYCSAGLWDGQPKHQTGWGYGH